MTEKAATKDRQDEGIARDWPMRLVAAAAFLGAAALFYLVTHLPVSAAVTPTQWTAARTEALTLAVPAASLRADQAVVTLTGPPGRDASLTFDKAAFSAKTLADFAAMDAAGAGAIPPVAWFSHAQGDDKATVEVFLEPTGPQPTLSFAPTGHGEVADVVLRARDARLRLRMVATADDPRTGEQELQGPGGAPAIQVAGLGAFPIEVVLPPGAPAMLQMPKADLDRADIRPGGRDQTSDAVALNANYLRLETGGGEDRLRACGAKEKAVTLALKVGLSGCQPLIHIVDMGLSPAGVSVEAHGFGFEAAGGAPTVLLSLQTITGNPLLAIALGGGYAGLAAWAGRIVFRPLKPKPAPTRKRARAKAT